MTDLKTYSDFASYVDWIRASFRRDLSKLRDPLRKPMERFATRRLGILAAQRLMFQVLPPRPIPYAVFWLSDALRLDEPDSSRELALALVYSSVRRTIVDDAFDLGRVSPGHAGLATYCKRRYVELLSELFPSDSTFWNCYRDCERELVRYDRWRARFELGPDFDPISEAFLTDASRYFVAVVLPSLEAIAIKAGRKEETSRLARFLREFSMGWRIFDDLSDWKRDLGLSKFNCSSVHYYAMRKMGWPRRLDKSQVEAVLLSKETTREVYDTMLSHFQEARKEVTEFHGKYMTQFMDEQVVYVKNAKETRLNAISDFEADLATLLLRSQEHRRLRTVKETSQSLK